MSEKVDTMFVGLGNPLPKYALTRHNLGQFVLDRFRMSRVAISWEEDDNGSLDIITLEDKRVMFLRPTGFMNNVGTIVDLYNKAYNPEKIVILHDDMTLKFGQVKIKAKGSAAGHNGLKSTIEALKTDEFERIRLGIGRPSVDKHTVLEWVLGEFTEVEKEQLGTIKALGCQKIMEIICRK